MAVGANKSKNSKAKKAEKSNAVAWDVLERLDGNPVTAAEFDKSEEGEGRYFFNAEDDASEEEKNRCMILNYIHCRLRTTMERRIPADMGLDQEYEVLHTEKFEGANLAVCVYFPPVVAGQKKECFATIKLANTDIGEGGNENGAVSTYKTLRSELVDDVISPANRHWVPRWTYVVKSLRARALHDFYKDGAEMERPEEEFDGRDENGAVDRGSQETVEDVYMVFAGAVGQIIGSKGAKIKEIKDASGVEEINTPPKSEDGPRPRARDEVEISLKGTQYNIEKAKRLIQVVVHEWATAPRPPRQDRQEYTQPSYDQGTGFDDENAGFGDDGNAAVGGGDNWAGGVAATGGEGSSWDSPAAVGGTGGW